MYYRYFNRTTLEVYDLNTNDFGTIADGMRFLFAAGHASEGDQVEPIGLVEISA